GVVLPTWGLQEGVLLVAFQGHEGRLGPGVFDLCFAGPGMDAFAVSLFVAVPGVRDVLLDLLRISCVHRIYVAEVAIQHYAARILERIWLVVTFGGELAVAEVVGQSA